MWNEKSDPSNYIHSDLYRYWFKSIRNKTVMYKEPILDSESIKFIKEVCDIFEQNTNVFILSVEVAEDFIRAKHAQNAIIKDWILVVVTITFICHKSEGAQDSLKIQHCIDVLYHFTKKLYKSDKITAMEANILETIAGRVPITTIIDDLDIIIKVHFTKWRLKVNIRPLCLKLVEFLYIERFNWFNQLKEVYNWNDECKTIFHSLITSKTFIPVSILLSALQLTQYGEILEMETILDDMSQYSMIHTDHLTVLSMKIMDLVNC